MNRMTGFIKKEILHIIRDYRSMIIIFALPTIQILLFGFVVSLDIKNVKVGVMDNSKDDVTRSIVQKIAATDRFKISEMLYSSDQIDRAFKKGSINCAIIFEDDFGQKLKKEHNADMALILDGSEPNTANLTANYTSSIIRKYQEENIPIDLKITQVKPDIIMHYNPELKSAYMFVPGVISMILMLISVLMTSVSITREKEFGSMEVLLVSPLRPIQIILGKVAPYLFLSFVDVVIILLMSYFIFELPMKGSLILLLGESMLFITLALSIGIFISTIAKNMQQAMFISLIGLLMPSMILSGFMFPIDNMPVIYHYVSLIMPPRWFISIIKNIMIKGTGFWAVQTETFILLGMTIFFIAISAKRFKIRLD